MMVAEAEIQPIHEDQLDHDVNVDDRSFGGGGGNRWPRQETLALLKIRSEMDAAFRDSSLKAPLWEDVSRKLGEQGYERSAKKCREKFENVYKYHRRTKEGRSGKPQGGKTYRFFDELEAFDQNSSHNPSSTIIPPKPPVVQWTNTNFNPIQNGVVVAPTMDNIPIIHQPNNNGFNLFSSSTSSATASDDEFKQRNNKRKRKWKYLFRRMTKRVLDKQERLQERFLQAVARCDQDRTAKEEAWRMQEEAWLDRHHEDLVQERSSAAAKHAALTQFLHNVSLQRNVRSLEINDAAAVQVVLNAPQPPLEASPVSWARGHINNATTTFDVEVVAPQSLEAKKVFGNGHGESNNNSEVTGGSSSRWPKTEVEALINLRTNLDVKYHDAGLKGSLWEEISAGMRRLGYERNSKRCKEKWENINKYFKKVKESSRTRPEDSKTCPYFHQLEALYKSKNSNKIEDRTVEKLQPIVVMRENVDQDQEEDDEEHDHQEGESTEEDQIGIVTSYKTSSMEIVES